MRSLLKSLVDPSISCQIENLEISAGWFGYIRCDRYLRPQRYAISRRTLDPTLRAAAAFDAVSGRMRQYLALSILPTCNQRERETSLVRFLVHLIPFRGLRRENSTSFLSLSKRKKELRTFHDKCNPLTGRSTYFGYNSQEEKRSFRIRKGRY